MDYEIMTMGDLLSNELDNASQDQLDDEIKLFKLYAKKLGIRDYNSLYVGVVEDDPSYVLQDELMLPSPDNDREIYLYPSAKVLVENYRGIFYIYSTSEDTIKNVFQLMDKFLNEEPINDIGFESKTTDQMVDEEENKSLINIQECLRLRDNRSNNKYNLYNKYVCESYTIE